MLQSYYSKPHQLPLGHCDSFSPGNSAFQTSATLCLKKHEYTQLPYESVFDRCSTISNNELDRNVELSINGISYFNYVEQPNTSRNIQNLSLFAETPPAVQNEEPGSCFSPPFVEGGGLTSFWNGRYPVSVIARRNERERNRVKTINQTFAKLRHHLPSGTGRRRKLSKVQILRLAIQYIHQLQKVLESETDKMEDQKKSDRQREPIENGEQFQLIVVQFVKKRSRRRKAIDRSHRSQNNKNLVNGN